MTERQTFSPAGFWKRYVAYFIDLVLIYLVIEVLNALFFSNSGISELDQVKALFSAALNQQDLPQDPLALIASLQGLLSDTLLFSSGAYVLLGAVYFGLCESSAGQATLGKRMIGIKVTDIQGARISLAGALARFFAAALSWLTLNLGHALAAWTPSRRALHDFIAGTRVENSDPSQTKMPLWGWVVIGAHALVFILMILATFALVMYVLNAMSNI